MKRNRPIEHDLSNLDLHENEQDSQSNRSFGKPVYWALLLSLLIHLTIVVPGLLMSAETKPQKTMVKPPFRAKLVPKKSPIINDEILSKQLVSTPKPRLEVRPKEAQFAAEHNSKVEEETRSRKTSLTPERLSEQSQMARAQNNDVPNPVPLQKPSLGSRKPLPKSISEKGLAKKPESQGELRSKLIPTWREQGMENAAPFSDHLKNIEEDAATRLNTWEWVHAPFFLRIKEAVARRWDPNGAIRRNDPQGRVIGKTDRVTQILAKISKEGELLSIAVTRESGIYFLDDAALNAFKEAAPFSNPPKELFAKNDTFEFPFGFMLTYNKGFKFDLDWKPF